MKKTLLNLILQAFGKRHAHGRLAMVRISTNQDAFTLIELLVVIAIIGLLSSVVLFSVNAAREKAYDTKRAQDMRQLQIAAELRILEKATIPVAADVDISKFASAESGAGGNKSLADRAASLVRFVTMSPEVAEANQAKFDASAGYYDDLFVGGKFFKNGTAKPQDPQCVAGQPNTCYRAYYDGNTLVIVATLRTKKHTSGFNVQVGMAVGDLTDANFVNTCQAIGYPVYSTASAALNTLSCDSSTPGGLSSVVQGITNGRDIVGATSLGSI
jgi:prepilin-type N-terminal cleavage/methylation domain-containing protein